MRNTRVIYADPALEAEYTAGAWAAALQAHRRTTVLAVFLLLFLPLATLALSVVRMSEAAAREAAAAVQESRNSQVLASFRELDRRVADVEDDMEGLGDPPQATASRSVIEAPAPVVVTAPATTTTSTTVAPGKAPTTTVAPAPTTTSTTAPIRACVLTVCLAVG